MKNKVKNILILFVIVTIFCIFGVKANAETTNSNIPETYKVKNEDIPNSTYVIGTHMLTREQNEETGYDGQLSTQLIMLASQTINSDNLDDMIIYYKNPRGKWVNALTEDTVIEPNIFEISKKDLVKYVPVPVLQLNTHIYSSLNQYTEGYINVKNYEVYYSESSEHTYNISGIEFSKTWTGGDGVKRYRIIDNITKPDSFISLSGYTKESYVARAYILDDSGNKIYSNYSNEVEYDVYESSDRNSLSLDEFKAVTSETTLGELKLKYNLEPSVANLAENTATYLYDFKGYVNHSQGITPNVQFEFGSDKDSATVKAKVYRNLVTDDEIDHSYYDDGDGEIEMSDFDSIELTTAEELMEVLGEPYTIKTIYVKEGTRRIPGIDLTYRIKDSDTIISFSFDDNGTGKSMSSIDYPAYYAKELLNKKYVTADGNYELEFTGFSDYTHNEVDFTITSRTGRIIRVDGEVRATTLEQLQPDYIFRGSVEGGVIIGRLRQSGNNKFIIDSYVFKKTENPDEYPEAFNNLDIGYNKIEFNLKAE